MTETNPPAWALAHKTWRYTASLPRTHEAAAEIAFRAGYEAASARPAVEGGWDSMAQLIAQARQLHAKAMNSSDLASEGAWGAAEEVIDPRMHNYWRVTAVRSPARKGVEPYAVTKALTTEPAVAGLLTFASTALPQLCDLAETALAAAPPPSVSESIRDHLPSADWLRRHVEADPNCDTEAGLPPPPVGDHKALIEAERSLSALEDELAARIVSGEPGARSCGPVGSLTDMTEFGLMCEFRDHARRLAAALSQRWGK